MSFTFVGRAVTSEGSFASGSSFALPSGTLPGDLLTISVMSRGNHLVNLPAGWIERFGANNADTLASGIGRPNVRNGYIIRGASAPAAALTGWTGNIRVEVTVLAYRPVDGAVEFVSESSFNVEAWRSAHDHDSIPSLQPDDLLVMGLSYGRGVFVGAADAALDPATASDAPTGGGAGAVAGTGMPSPGSWLNRHAFAFAGGDSIAYACHVADGVMAAAGATGTLTASTGGVEAPGCGSTMAFRASAPAGPTINTQPSNQSVTAPAAATFTVSATASAGSLTYQWRRNGTNISGATSASYTTPATTVSGGTANNGDVYSVVVTDSNGSVTSSNATLTVTAPPLSVTLDALVDESGTPRAAYTVDKVWAIRASDNTLVATWTAQTTNGSGVLPALSNAALTAVPHVFVTWDDNETPNNAGAKTYTPA